MNDSEKFSLHDELNPDIWEEGGDTIQGPVRKKLLEIAHEFVSFVTIEVAVVDIILTGSNANYNYTPSSDLDLHIVYSPGKEGYETYDKGVLKELFTAKKTLWNEHHKGINIYGHPVELYLQDETEALFATGVYSLEGNEWILRPSADKPEIDNEGAQAKAQDFKDMIDHAIEDASSTALETIKERIRALRKAGLEKGGEYSSENLAFKILRNSGYLEKLSQAESERYDKTLSLEGLGV